MKRIIRHENDRVHLCHGVVTTYFIGTVTQAIIAKLPLCGLEGILAFRWSGNMPGHLFLAWISMEGKPANRVAKTHDYKSCVEC